MAILRQGSRGQEVKNLQMNLNKLGYNVGNADAIFGGKTAQALKNFQKAQGLTVDAIAGNQTFTALNKALSQKTSPTQQTQKPKTTATTAPKPAQPTFNYMPYINDAQTFAGQTPQDMRQSSSSSSINLEELLKRSTDLLTPGTQLQKDAATSGMNAQMQKLQNQWAQRGLLASGGAMAQQRAGAESLAGQLAGIEASQQEKALGTAYDLGNFYEKQRQFDIESAIKEGELTGQYLPSGARDMINDLMSQKAIAERKESTPQQKAQAQARAEQLRTQLGLMGVDTSKIGSGVNLQTALTNLTRLGTPTENRRQFDKELGLERDRFGLDKQKFGLEQERFGLEQERFSFEKDQAKIDEELKRAGLDIDRARVAIDEMNSMTDQDYKRHLAQLDIDDRNAAAKTSSTVAYVLSLGSVDEAYKYLMQNSEKLYKDGIDVRQVMDALEFKFGTSGGESETERPK